MPMTETLSRQSRLQPISEHIETHVATKTKPVTIFMKIDYFVIYRFEFAIRYVASFRVRDLLESQQEKKSRTIDPATQNVPYKESTGDNRKAPQEEGILHHNLTTATLPTAVDVPQNE
jgi:hypothetical protein